MENSTEKICIHIFEYSELLNVIKNCSMAGFMGIYQMPNQAISYKEDVKGFLNTLLSFGENEKWRLTSKKLCPMEIVGEEIIIGGKKIKDIDMGIAVAAINSFFIIPGEQSIASGDFNRAEVIQLSNMIKNQPLILTLEDIPDESEEGKFKLYAKFSYPNKNKKEDEV